jgi:hypothetical protein
MLGVRGLQTENIIEWAGCACMDEHAAAFPQQQSLPQETEQGSVLIVLCEYNGNALTENSFYCVTLAQFRQLISLYNDPDDADRSFLAKLMALDAELFPHDFGLLKCTFSGVWAPYVRSAAVREARKSVREARKSEREARKSARPTVSEARLAQHLRSLAPQTTDASMVAIQVDGASASREST